MEEQYLTDVSVEETVAGFVLTEIDNPDRNCYGHPKKIKAVVYQCGPSHRLVKLRQHYGEGHYYHLEVFGKYRPPLADPAEKPTWHPLRDDTTDIDPLVITEAVGRWIEENPLPQFIVCTPP